MSARSRTPRSSHILLASGLTFARALAFSASSLRAAPNLAASLSLLRVWLSDFDRSGDAAWVGADAGPGSSVLPADKAGGGVGFL